MLNNPELIELIVIAAIAAGLIYKFFYTLGEKRGFEKPASDDAMFTMNSTDTKKAESESTVDTDVTSVPEHFKETLKSIQQIDNRFSLKAFLDGAVMAFEMILQAYGAGDRKLLQNLLNESIYKEFEAAITERENQGQKLSTTLVKLSSPEIENIYLQGSIAEITLKYTSDQTNIIYDKNGQILEGSPNQIEEVVDVWTFRRDLRASNPNWTLVETGA